MPPLVAEVASVGNVLREHLLGPDTQAMFHDDVCYQRTIHVVGVF